MLSVIRGKLGRLCSKIWWTLWKRPRSKVVIRRFRKLSCKSQSRAELWKCDKKATIHSNGGEAGRPIRVATFNVAMFSLAPAVSELDHGQGGSNRKNSKMVEFPKSILKQSPLHCDSKIVPRSNLKVSINLPDNEISLANSRLLASMREKEGTSVPARSPVCFPFLMNQYEGIDKLTSSRSILEVLREIDADVVALQDVKAEEEKGMRPLSDLAGALGMKYVFAESWAPEFGNAILSKWPIKRCRVQKIADDEDFRNVLKATIDVPWAGEINFHSTQLDHLDESWRMKQVNAIIHSNDPPHILAGGLNSLCGADYSSQRWNDIVKYYEKLGKPRPKTDVMNLMNSKDYVDSKDYAGEFEPIVIIAKGQNVQGTCKYGTRVDYILASPNSPYKYVPGSYSVISSKGTSDHHIVKVDIVKMNTFAHRQCRKLKNKVVRIRTPPCSASATAVCKSTPSYLIETKPQI
ncbi:hypothetical protein HN51_064867 [Arachis hypogaea]|uniref:Endonuclease/exonuclease/phosphatase domain-containing protein n=1 Tax=Arachis hypogaea TaxID=3818 RepID=A0A444ZCA4_ARAHY|nr:uncharacterized protein LOC107638541 [Arachis ipaensis]XP_025645740.1 uncharacterized protein LOC112741113 [Arachis hypogaea]QHO05899.1 uncharacterized protein DS421_14g450020 [Arachis hypogaea]RYR11812.1 hypothetical protein Ahy_B04g069322 [Arachis hypogaea]